MHLVYHCVYSPYMHVHVSAQFLQHIIIRVHETIIYTDEFSRGMVEEYYNLNIAEQLCR